MKQTPHIFAAALALVVSLTGAFAFSIYANHFEQKYVHAVAGIDHADINGGSALERVALQQNDLLLIYGASELALLDTPYQANRFFSTYPTGFMVFNDATLGGSSLTIAQKFAGLGEDLRGKRVILALGPAIMTMAPAGEVNIRHYTGNFSTLNALEIIYSRQLSMETRRIAAARMLDFPETLQDQPFIKFALEHLAGNTPLDNFLYYLSWPLGRLQISVGRVQDHYATFNFIRHNLSAQEVQIHRQPRAIDWAGLVPIAEKEQIKNTDTNTFGIDNSQWHKIQELFAKPHIPGSKDADFIYDVEHAREWQDLDITLRTIQELGANVVILSVPMNVPLWEYQGVSERAQNTYYIKLHEVVAPYNLPIIDLHEYGTMPYFSMDLASHTSRKGWIYVDQTLDAIFHGLLP